jgi:hypothetical protein
MNSLVLLGMVGGVVWTYMTLVYGVALFTRRNDWADVAWGLGFWVVALVIFTSLSDPPWRSLLILVLVGLWALRLSLFIYGRMRAHGEDFRYAAWRKQWGRSVYWRSYFQVFLLQGALLVVVGLPVWFGLLSSGGPVRIMDVIGVFIWLFGLSCEAVADSQMAQFRKNRSLNGASENRIMMDGLWRYSRHPNYFGEATLWWGVFLFCLSSGAPAWTVVGPLLINFLLLRVSGVPMLESKYKNNDEYQHYRKVTSSFILWFPKK